MKCLQDQQEILTKGFIHSTKSIADKRVEIPIKRLLRVKNTHSYYKNKPTLLR